MDSGLAFAAVIAGGLVTTFFAVSMLEFRKKGRERRELEARERGAALLRGEPVRTVAPRDPQYVSPVPAPRNPT